MMEQPCYKCGETVEQGIPFCRHCSAPQIRVVVAEPVAIASPAADETSYAATVRSEAPAIPGSAISWRWTLAVRPCALAALIAAVAMILKLMIPVIAVIGAGFLAVAFFRRRSPDVAMRAGLGGPLGALSGLFCFGMTAILGAMQVAVLHQGGEIRKFMLDAVEQTAQRLPDPQYQPGLDFMRSPAGLVFMIACLLVVLMLAFLVLGTLGGVVAGAVLGRRNRT